MLFPVFYLTDIVNSVTGSIDSKNELLARKREEAGEVVKHERAGRVQLSADLFEAGLSQWAQRSAASRGRETPGGAVHAAHALPARPRPHRPQQVVPAAQAQDPGVHIARRATTTAPG